MEGLGDKVTPNLRPRDVRLIFGLIVDVSRDGLNSLFFFIRQPKIILLYLLLAGLHVPKKRKKGLTQAEKKGFRKKGFQPV